MGLLVKNKQIVVPGEILATGLDFLPGVGTYREGDNIHALMVGLSAVDGRTIKLIKLAGKYLPKRGDTIIARVKDIAMSGWRVELNSAYTAMLGLKDASRDFIPRDADLSSYYNIGDYIVTQITKVTSQRLIDIKMIGPGLRKLPEGRILKVTPCKVPRIIGKKGSMVTMIKQATDCNLIVGQNGVVWLSGKEPKMENVAVESIRMIEKLSHTSGLTEKIKTFLEEKTGKKLIINKGE